MGTEGLSQAYLRLIHDIATRLSRDDCKNLLYLSGLSAQSLPSSFNGCGSSHRCCTSICGPLDLLTHMQSEGLFSECNLTPLVSLLQDLGRNDLASKCSLLKDASKLVLWIVMVVTKLSKVFSCPEGVIITALNLVYTQGRNNEEIIH